MNFDKTVFLGLSLSLLPGLHALEARVGVTPVNASDQSLTQKDIDLRARIRREVMNNSSLSSQAKNIQIISQDGRVTLKGEVAKTSERNWIERMASRTAGSENVTSDLTVK